MPRAILPSQLCCLYLAFASANLASAIDLPELIAKVEPSVVRIEVETANGAGIGSGFLTAQGVVTNYHVIGDATRATVSFADNAAAKVLGVLAYDASRDVAVLAVETEGDRPTLKLSSEPPRKGEPVAAFGAPKGFSFTTSDGIISGLRSGAEIKKALPEYRYSQSASWIQTTAAISPGNSGGPLVNARGEVVGMNSWTHREGQNLNFAISCSDIQSVIDRIEVNEIVGLGSLKEPVIAAVDAELELRGTIFAASLTKNFESELNRFRRQVELIKSQLETASRSAHTTEASIRRLEEKHQAGLERLAKLTEFVPQVPLLTRSPQDGFGYPGVWYVLQVLGPDCALIKSHEDSDTVYYLSGTSMAGTVDGAIKEFDGIWFVLGDTHTYSSVAGGTNTVLRVRGLGGDEQELRSFFKERVATPKVQAALEDLAAVDLPAGEELERLRRARAAWERSQALRVRDFRREQSEQRAEKKVTRALAMLSRNQELATKWLQDVIEQEPESASANRARRTLGIAPVSVSRTWTAGEHTTEAKLIEVNGGSATIEKPDGKRVAVPISRLCDRDQEYIRCFAGE